MHSIIDVLSRRLPTLKSPSTVGRWKNIGAQFWVTSESMLLTYQQYPERTRRGPLSSLMQDILEHNRQELLGPLGSLKIKSGLLCCHSIGSPRIELLGFCRRFCWDTGGGPWEGYMDINKIQVNVWKQTGWTVGQIWTYSVEAVIHVLQVRAWMLKQEASLSSISLVHHFNEL